MPDLTPPPMSDWEIVKIYQAWNAGPGGISHADLIHAAIAARDEQWRQRLEAVDYSRDWDVLYRIKEQG